MYNYYLTGNTYHLKGEIKNIKPKRKHFRKWWKYNYDFKAWELNVSNSCNSKRFKDKLQLFCDEHNLELEILEFTQPLSRPMNNFDSIEAFFDYFHSQNNKNIKF